ncbi:hypothetical protein ADIMK_0412 [Marinobacterium lacunae]|uniref:Uncharacterized protein n=1 Tax=Marinobacterium lacunae TaxID=1232683 RepID=A0A081G3V0_9GAMM|nr:hypothetical protein ADIMK_0412 [Marinobacterium lacunae]
MKNAIDDVKHIINGIKKYKIKSITYKTISFPLNRGRRLT